MMIFIKKMCPKGFIHVPINSIGMEKNFDQINFFIPNEFIGTKNFQKKNVPLNSLGINVISLGPNFYQK